MGRTFSLRGELTIADNAILAPSPLNGSMLLDYQSPDRRKAWKVNAAYMWPRDVDEEIGSTDGMGILNATLFTDQMRVPGFNDMSAAGENRQFGWCQQQFLIRHAGTDFAVANGGNGIADFLIDPDTLVTKEMYLGFFFRTESATSPERTWNYMIELEEVKISSNESILQQLKGIGQDIDS